MTIKIEITGGDYDDILNQMGATRIGDRQSTESLLEDLRARLRPQKLCVIIANDETADRMADQKEVVKSVKEPNGELVSTEPPKRRGRPPKAVAEVAARSADAEDGDRLEEAEAQKVNGGAALPTRDDVIIALNKYAESHGGQAAGRSVMQQVCGVTRLVDCTPSDYPKLLEALGA